MTERADLAEAWDAGYRHGRDAEADATPWSQGLRQNPHLQAEPDPPPKPTPPKRHIGDYGTHGGPA